ncbi:MAG TPA: translational GTPase TypA [Firmicutes bacterium]|nr:translational GTPase TypA [Bacillota bacterium]
MKVGPCLNNTLQTELRNVAMIAHVDHGKTTLVDALLRQAGIFRAHEQVVDRVLDSNDLERERGITILAKNTAVRYGELKINIVDTPGHADFGGEVERVLKMVDGALLLVDAFEGPMAQTKFVLRKALAAGLRIIVVINKLDRPDARPDDVLNEIFDLFVDLDAASWQLDFPVIYASARQGIATLDPQVPGEDMRPLLEMIKNKIPAPTGDLDQPLQLQIVSLDYDDYVGKIAIGRIANGTIRVGETVGICTPEHGEREGKIGLLWVYEGLKRSPVEIASAGEIVAFAGLSEVNIGETVCHLEQPRPLPMLTIDEPTLAMTFMVNDSPFAGREGKYITSRHLRERLWKEAQTNVSLKVAETDSPDAFQISGRGELHLSILIETMRREGYELQISKPEPITKLVDGKLLEPYERLFILVPEAASGPIIENLGQRRAELINMAPSGSNLNLEYLIPARGLIGFRSQFLTDTKGEGVMHHLFDSYGLWKDGIGQHRQGSLVAFEDGDATAYGIHNVEDRGVLFVVPGEKIYTGMVIGIHHKDDDLDINVCKKKHLTNMRSSNADEAIRLVPPLCFSLEQAMEFIAEDELVEVTPQTIRMRKKVLDRTTRARLRKKP